MVLLLFFLLFTTAASGTAAPVVSALNTAAVNAANNLGQDLVEFLANDSFGDRTNSRIDIDSLLGASQWSSARGGMSEGEDEHFVAAYKQFIETFVKFRLKPAGLIREGQKGEN